MNTRPDDDMLYELRRKAHAGFEELDEPAVYYCQLDNGATIILVGDIEDERNLVVRCVGKRRVVGMVLTDSASEDCGDPGDRAARGLVAQAMDVYLAEAAKQE